ncbi:MAG TPA: 3-deoxy-7-phosphoheptulonate synthase, partial [Gemmatales bacterium]|nr:3-deoxy-7-phosphoheptulonate synthase [Gemmatales bacterium]
MLVVMKRDATPEQVEHVVNAIRESGLMPHPLPGATRTAIGITGNTGSVDSRNFEVLPGVLECIRVTKAYKLTGREMHPQDTILRVGSTTIGAGTFTIIAGPCSVENETLTFRMAEMLMQRGI